jgi:hypothetical protein
MKKIKSIEKGAGEGSSYYAVNDQYPHAQFKDKIHEIKEEEKFIGKGMHNDLTIIVYRGYTVSGHLLFEIEANSSLTVAYDTVA